MPSNIKNNSVRDLRFRCRNDEYYDFMLYRGECKSNSKCMVASINANTANIQIGEPICRIDKNGKPTMVGGEITSDVIWGDAYNDGTVLEDIGLTGIDNGFISYEKDKITNKEFIDMYTGTTYYMPYSKNFYMSPVSSNTGSFEYPMTLEEDESGKYFAFKGGFFQGFFKLHGLKYQTLPSYIEDNWNLRFVLRNRTDYNVKAGTINNLHKDNKGIFFYMGTRAENKFWELYNNVEDKAEFLIPSVFNDGYFDGCCIENYITAPDYTEYQSEIELCPCEEDGCEVKPDEKAWCPEYWEKDLDLAEIEVRTTLGYDVNEKGQYEIETDNKFIFFNRTETGYTINDWDASENDYVYDECSDTITQTGDKQVVILTGVTNNCKENKFITYNRTQTGKTVNTIDVNDNYTPYDVYKDIKNNAFAIKINEDGSIGYKYGVTNCNEPHNYGVEEERSMPGIIPDNKWVVIDVRFKILNTTYKQCFIDNGQTVKMVPNNIGSRKMKIYIYVNGYLKFISKELPEFNFRELDDIYQKQEGVPFSMSLGGGTQGLLETVSLNYYRTPEYCLPIERDFAGTFMGDIRSFEFYDCFIDPQTIRNEIKSKGLVS